MRRVLPAPAAELLQLQPFRHRLPVLGGRIVPLFAITALQRNDLSGHGPLPKIAASSELLASDSSCHPEATSEITHYFFFLLGPLGLLLNQSTQLPDAIDSGTHHPTATLGVRQQAFGIDFPAAL
jgi:hypothetical protein